jgi:hypothetical protein
MAKIETFEDLEIWNRAIDLYVEVYTKCENSGLKNDFSAKDQLKRATLSISNNIAEGFDQTIELGSGGTSEPVGAAAGAGTDVIHDGDFNI